MKARLTPVLVLALSLLTGLSVAQGEEEGAIDESIEPIDIGFQERTGRSLLFLDVEAVRSGGQPMTGLTREDFKIRLNYKWRKIYSVDDLCPCGIAAPDPERPPSDPAAAARLAVATAPPHFVLYFDFSQLGSAGRAQAVEQARLWAKGGMLPGDRVMVAAYATEAGLRTLTDFTDDPKVILEAIETGASMPEMIDPFPEQYEARLSDCATGTLTCYHTGRQEYFHARRSMETLRNFLTGLDAVAERKTLALFHQNTSMFPGRMYGGVPEYFPRTLQEEIRGSSGLFEERMSEQRRRDLVPDLQRLEEEVGGSATASRVEVYPVLCGAPRTWTINLGANLADQTGGEQGWIANLDTLLNDTARRCSCIYRIGLELADKEKSFVLRAKVKVGKRKLPSRYRIQYLSDADRWMRKAQLVMANPDQWRGVQVSSAIVPLRASGKTWDVAVQIAVDVSSLRPSFDAEHGGEWEVAGLLGDEEFEKSWEMLGVYRARSTTEMRASGIVLHERVIEGLKPGRYELRGFVRDREANVFGGTQFALELPDPRKEVLAGPVMVRLAGRHFRTSWPLRKDRNPAQVSSRRYESGLLPLGEGIGVPPGEPVQFLTWRCGAAEGESTLRSAVRHGDDDPWTSRPSRSDHAGDCIQLSDIVETGLLAPGRYVYEVTSTEQTAAGVEAAFEVLADAEDLAEEQATSGL